MVEWDKDDLDALGILKIDILALGMLTCIRKAFDLLDDHYDQPADPGDDAEGGRHAHLRHDLPRRHARRLPDRKPGADVDAAAAEAAPVSTIS